MRLIDADMLLKKINGEENQRADKLMREWYAAMVSEQPTAYDVGKVVEKIREYADNVAELGGNFLPQVVIEIVKSGGND